MNNPINQITKLQPIRCLGLILILIGYSLTNLSSQTVTWSSTTMDSDWNNPNNWIPAQVPLITDNVEIGANTNSIWPEIKNGNTALAKTVKVEGADLTIKAGGRLEIINMVSQERALQKLRSGTLLIEVGAELIINAQGSGIYHNNLNNSLTGKVVNHGTIQIKNAATGISIDSNGSFENHGYIRIISSTDESIYVWQASPLGTIPSGYFINYECGYISVDENIKDYPQTNSNAGFTNDGTITIDDDEISLMQTNNGLIHNLGIGSINPQSNTGIIDDHPAANYWLGCHSTLWSDSTSWSRSRVPIAGDSVVVLDSFAINHLSIDISTDAVMHVFNLDTITILSGATLSIDGSFSNASTVNGYQNQNKTIIEAGAELNIANTISVGLLNSRAGGVSIFINNGLISANNNSGTSISNANFSLLQTMVIFI